MKTVTLYEAKTHLSRLIGMVEAGEDVVVTKHGRAVARITAVNASVARTPGDWRTLPGWEDYVYDPSVFAPLSEQEMRDEGWPV